MMLREIDRKFYGEGTAAIPAEAGIRRNSGKMTAAEAPNRISAVKAICRQ